MIPYCVLFVGFLIFVLVFSKIIGCVEKCGVLIGLTILVLEIAAEQLLVQFVAKLFLR